jgi:long-chain acyl-CoA synthetase
LNLSNIILHAARYFPDKEAIVFENTRITYKRLNDAVNHVASYMRELGIKQNDRIALYCENRPEWIMLYYGIIRCGAVVVCMSSAYRRTELAFLLEDSQPACIVTSESLVENIPGTVTSSLDAGVLVIDREDVRVNLRLSGSALSEDPFQAVERNADDTCTILYTGGTTGIPKGAMLTHRNILFTAQNVCYHERMTVEDRGLCFLPLSHVFAGNHIMNALFSAFGTLVLHKGFDMDEIISSIDANGVTRLYAVPTVYIRLLNTPECHSRLRTVGYSFSAATSMPPEIVLRWKDVFGLNIHEAYGMTESASLVTYNHLYRHKIGSVGTPAGVVEICIGDDNGNPLSQGEAGEILIRGPNVMKGYYNHPEETAVAMKGGWLHSGDVGRMDSEGYLYIVDRIKDMIISGGLNIYPTEVENILYSHDAVEECAVAGLSHEEYGEAVTAFVRLKPGCVITESDLIQFCKEQLARYKAPKKIVFVKEFPRTPQGKLLKRELRKFCF